MTKLKSGTISSIGRHFPGTDEVQEWIRTLSVSDFAKDMLVQELTSLWLIMDNRSEQEICLKYRNLYSDALRQMGAKPPRAATVSARPITREEFEAITSTEEEG